MRGCEGRVCGGGCNCNMCACSEALCEGRAAGGGGSASAAAARPPSIRVRWDSPAAPRPAPPRPFQAFGGGAAAARFTIRAAAAVSTRQRAVESAEGFDLVVCTPL